MALKFLRLTKEGASLLLYGVCFFAFVEISLSRGCPTLSAVDLTQVVVPQQSILNTEPQAEFLIFVKFIMENRDVFPLLKMDLTIMGPVITNRGRAVKINQLAN